MMKRLLGGVTAAFLLATSVAWGAGIYTNGLPAATSPLTGAETIPADTNLSGGQYPQTESITVNQLLGQLPGRNVLRGGDFGTNPWQRGTSALTATSTVTYTADGWFVRGSAGSAITVAKQTANQTAGFGGSLRFQRDSANADTNVLYLGQAVETQDSYQLQGKTVAFSFYAKVGANYSPASSALGVAVVTGTGSNGSAANMLNGSWTGYAVASCSASSVTLTTSWARYTVTCSIPSTAVQVGVRFAMTPVGTAGANDWFEVTGIQLEAIQSSGTAASSFEFLNSAQVLARAQRYYTRQNEGAATVTYWIGQNFTTSTCQITIPFPVEMRTTPTATITAGGFVVTEEDGTTEALDSLTIVASSLTTRQASVLADTTGTTLVAGSACLLQGGAGAGVLAFSAEL